jgi:hypothetical protein
VQRPFRTSRTSERRWAGLGRALLACGALSSLLYVAGVDVIAPLLHPDYHGYTSQMVSELMADGAPTRELLVWLLVPYNLLVLAFAAGVWASAGDNRALHGAAAALAGYGALSFAGLLLAPMDLRGTVGSERDALHIAVTVAMSIFIVGMMAFGAFALGRRFKGYSLATIAVVVVFGALAGWLARPMPGPTPWIGVAERINIYATMLWLAVLGACLLRARRADPATDHEAA